ncbi:MAG: hypothetical protein ACM3SY_01020 [Candidatus Omnitrophota bacterium]
MTLPKQRAVFLLLVCLFPSLFLRGGQDLPSDSQNPMEKKPQPVSITLFIPGIEQLKTGKTIKGTLLLGAFTASIVGAFVYNHQGLNWFDDYQQSTHVQDIIYFRSQTEKSFKKRNLCIAGIFSVWLVHLIDLKFFKSEKSGVICEADPQHFHIGFYYNP